MLSPMSSDKLLNSWCAILTHAPEFCYNIIDHVKNPGTAALPTPISLADI